MHEQLKPTEHCLFSDSGCWNLLRRFDVKRFSIIFDLTGHIWDSKFLHSPLLKGSFVLFHSFSQVSVVFDREENEDVSTVKESIDSCVNAFYQEVEQNSKMLPV